jgi:hypothetical protein
LFGEVPDAPSPAPDDPEINPSNVGRTPVKKFLALATALCVAFVTAPAVAITPELAQPEITAAKAKKKKKRVRYRIEVNYESSYNDVTDCRSITNGTQYRIKDSTSGVTKYSETGYYPGGSRRTGYREGTIKTESDDPYVPSNEQKLPRQEINDVFGPDQWDLQVNAKRTKFSYDWENAEGGYDDVVLRAPARVGKSTKKKLSSTWRSPDKTDEDGRCTSWSERTVNETITITRID